MDEGGAQLVTALDTSCCFISRVPAPDSQYKTSRSSLTAARALVLGTAWALPPLAEERAVEVVLDLHSPPLSSFLCTFLI